MMENRPILCYPVAVLLIVALCISSGCVNSHQQEKNEAFSHIASAQSRLVILNHLGHYTNKELGETIRANATAAKSDLTEASEILKNIPLSDLNSTEQADVHATIVQVNVYSEYCDLWAGPLSTYIESFQIWSRTGDPGTVAKSEASMNTALSEANSSVNRIIEELNSINEDALSPERRAVLISDRAQFLKFRDSIMLNEKILEDA